MRFLKKEINQPFASKGKWHRIFIESKNDDVIITAQDIDCILDSNGCLAFPEHFHVIDFKYDINSVASDADTIIPYRLKFEDDGTQAINLPLAKSFDYGYVYAFGYYK